jgi:hypothetical protein
LTGYLTRKFPLLLPVRPKLLEPADILAVEQWSIAAIDSKDEPILNPLMDRLPFYGKELTHIGDREQLARSFFLKEAEQRGMHQLPQFAPLPFAGEAEALGSERFTIEATSHKARRGPYILFKWIRIALCIVGNGGKMLSEQGFTQVFYCWRCRSLPARWLAVVDQFLHTGVHALKRVVNDLLVFGYQRSSVLYSVTCLVYGQVN